MAKAKPKASTDAGVIEVTRLKRNRVQITLRGITPLIPHAWSEKAKRQMPGHPDAPKEKVKKGPHKPKEEAEACLYKMSRGRLGMPAVAFKAAMVAACRFFKVPSMTEAKIILFVEGEGAEQLVEIKHKKKILREDLPRNKASGGKVGSPDLRYRYALDGWSAVIVVRYIATRITRESIVALADAAGNAGIGDWRPSSPESFTGTFGQFEVDDKAGVRDVT